MPSHAPEELTRGRLRRLGEGVGRVVYASEHWVVRRERTGSEVIALIIVWKVLRRLARILPSGWGRRLLEKPSKRNRLMRVMLQAVVVVIPRSVWFMTHIGYVRDLYHSRDVRGRTLAAEYLTGTSLVPELVTFPPVRVKVGGWPGWLSVSEATERVEATLYQRLTELAGTGDFDQVERWLARFLVLRQTGWQHGLYSVDPHLKNFGVTEDRVVLLDPGGLTDRWEEIDDHLSSEAEVACPHVQLGLGDLLASRPDIASRFDDRWKAIVNPEHVRSRWPPERLP